MSFYVMESYVWCHVTWWNRMCDVILRDGTTCVIIFHLMELYMESSFIWRYWMCDLFSMEPHVWCIFHLRNCVWCIFLWNLCWFLFKQTEPYAWSSFDGIYVLLFKTEQNCICAVMYVITVNLLICYFNVHNCFHDLDFRRYL